MTAVVLDGIEPKLRVDLENGRKPVYLAFYPDERTLLKKKPRQVMECDILYLDVWGRYQLLASGRATCNPKDKFDRKLGNKIALAHALHQTEPKEPPFSRLERLAIMEAARTHGFITQKEAL